MTDLSGRHHLPLPAIHGPAQKYLSKSSESLFHNEKETATTALRAPPPRKPTLIKPTKSLSIEDNSSSAHLDSPPKSPRFRRLQLPRSGSLNLLDEGTSGSGTTTLGPGTISPRRSRSPKPPAERPLSRSLPLKTSLSFDSILVPESLKSGLSRSPPSSTAYLALPATPKPPGTPRDRSRSKSPYRGTHSRTSMTDTGELSPWDFPNSLRSHSPIPPRRLTTIRKPGENVNNSANASSRGLKKQSSTTSQGSVDIVISNEEDTNNEAGEVITSSKDSIFKDGDDDLQWNHRIEIPDSSDIFQQALAAMRTRGSRESSASSCCSTASDPGDLHIRRSSLVATQMAQLVPDAPSDDLDTLVEDVEIPKFSTSKKAWGRVIQTVLDNITKMRSRKMSLPNMMMIGTTSEADGETSGPKATRRRKRAATLTTAPTRELLQTKGTSHEAEEKKPMDGQSFSFSDGALMILRSEAARQKLAEERAREQTQSLRVTPRLSMKAVSHMTKFITAASASCSVGGISSKSSNLFCKEVTKLPQLCNNGRMMQRQRRDSLRLIRYMVEEQAVEGDTSEVASFDDLRDCRYLRSAKPKVDTPEVASFDDLSNYLRRGKPKADV